MSRVAVRLSNGDNTVKAIPFIPALLAGAKALGGAALRGVANVAGKTALGQGFTAARGATGLGAKLKEGAKAYGKAKAGMGGNEEGETDGAAVAAKLAQQSMANQAKARQDRLQNQKEQNMQMADRAKENSQIAAGEPMDLAWRMLKQMSDKEMQEYVYANLRNQGITIPDEREEEVVPKPEIPILYY